MKNILFFGKMNQVTTDIGDAIKEFFRIQYCADDVSLFKEMMKLVPADLMIISLVGLGEKGREVFELMQTKYKTIPVITIGTEFEKDDFKEYYDFEQFENLKRPVKRKLLVDRCCDKLAIEKFDIREDEEEQNQKKTILVVDDSVLAIRTIRECLQDVYNIEIAVNASQALTSIGRNKPDLMLLDFEMPGISGKELFRILRYDEQTKTIPIAFMIGESSKETIAEMAKLNADGYMMKPPAQDKWIVQIESILKKFEK